MSDIENDTRTAFVYLIATCDAGAPRSYVGWTYDVERRLATHNSGKGAKATRGRRWALVHCKELASKQEAMSAEYHFKRDRGERARLLAAYRKVEHASP